MFPDPSRIDTALRTRSVSFENPTGAPGAGGTEGRGRKGAPLRNLAAGETVVLCDLEGPGTIRHVWLTLPPAPPEVLRAQVLEVFYDGAPEPSVSVPVLDFFALPHGRTAPLYSALVAVHEGRGFNSYVPMPFLDRIRIELRNGSDRMVTLYFQLDLTLDDALPADAGYLHASFRRENPTVQGRDFVITDGWAGPGRFLGCSVGVRVLDEGRWYGEGEVKVYLDDDTTHPTICGTGLEDYVGTGWGMGVHCGPYAGAPLEVRAPGPEGEGQPDFVGFYRWHVPDPIVFRDRVRVTIQQLGAAMFPRGDRAARDAYEATHPVAGRGWLEIGPVSVGVVERIDDYCATAFVYLSRVQSVPRVDVAAATADLARRPYEPVHPMESFGAAVEGAIA